MMSNAPRISHLKQAAREIKRSGALSHCQALDAVARENGFPNWKGLLAFREAELLAPRSNATAPVRLLTIPKHLKRIYHRVEIEGFVFHAAMSVDGPYLQGEGAMDGGVNLGNISQIRHFDDGRGWWLVKYEDQPRLDLNALSDAGRAALMETFGLTSVHEERRLRAITEAVYGAPAFRALPAWVRSHPRLAAEASKQSVYLPDWMERAWLFDAGVSP